MSMRQTSHLVKFAWTVALCLLLPVIAMGQSQQAIEPEALLLKAQESFQAGRYEQARKRFQRVLDLDPNNRVAFKGLARTDREIEQAQGQAQDIQKSAEADESARINRKLQTIILPQVFFDHIRLADVVEYLQRESIRLDPDQRGVNITVRYPVSSAGAIERSSVPGLPGYGSDPLLPPAPLTPDLAISLPSSSNIPLLDALRWMAQLAELNVKILSGGVQLVSQNELQTKEFKIPPGMSLAKEPPTNADANASGVKTESPSEDAKEYLKNCGIQFRQGTSLEFIPSAQKLIVRDTQDNIDLVEATIEALVAHANGTALAQ